LKKKTKTMASSVLVPSATTIGTGGIGGGGGGGISSITTTNGKDHQALAPDARYFQCPDIDIEYLPIIAGQRYVDTVAKKDQPVTDHILMVALALYRHRRSRDPRYEASSAEEGDEGDESDDDVDDSDNDDDMDADEEDDDDDDNNEEKEQRQMDPNAPARKSPSTTLGQRVFGALFSKSNSNSQAKTVNQGQAAGGGGGEQTALRRKQVSSKDKVQWSILANKTKHYYDIFVKYPHLLDVPVHHINVIWVKYGERIDTSGFRMYTDPCSHKQSIRIRVTMNGYLFLTSAAMMHYEQPPQYFVVEEELGEHGEGRGLKRKRGEYAQANSGRAKKKQKKQTKEGKGKEKDTEKK
jgi:hypothetical protein